MRRRRSHYFDDSHRPSPQWQCVESCGKVKTFELGGTGFTVQHCGHPTALWPWYGTDPEGLMILAPNGRGFQYLKDALLSTERKLCSYGVNRDRDSAR